VFVYHRQRRAELGNGAPDGVLVRVDRVYAAAVCLAMVQVALVAAVFVGSAGYHFFGSPITDTGANRDLAMVNLVAFGALLVVAAWVFRAHFWGIRGGDDADDGPIPADER
jgi:hypothetical protein